MEAFSDGVFAIVITLLIFNLHAPSVPRLTWRDLHPLVPQLIAFALSFVIVGVYWVAHHHMLHFVHKVDRRLLWLNLLLLFFVVLIPFPTSLLAGGLSNSLPVRLYGLTLIATNLAGLLFWLYATAHRDLVVPQMDRGFARWVAKVHSTPMLAYAVAVALAGWHTSLSLILFVLVPLFFILPNPLLERRLRSLPAESSSRS